MITLLTNLHLDPHEWAFAQSCEESGCCKRTLERACKALGTSPNTEIARARVLRAAGLLASPRGTHYTIERAAKVGNYKSARRLQEAITREFGLTPSQLRRGLELRRTIDAIPQRRQELPTHDPKRRAYHRLQRTYRDATEEMKTLLLQATPLGRDVLDGRHKLLTPSELREQAQQLATKRVIELHKRQQGQALRSVA